MYRGSLRYTTDIKRTSFLHQYLKDVRMVGAIAPSSRFLTKKMLANIDFSHVEVIVEYGPGTGVFTREIVAKLPQSAQLLVIETNKVFYDVLADQYMDNKQVIVVNDSAERVIALLSQYGLRSPDYIVSGLPFAALPTEVSHIILKNTAELLGNTGVFVTFQYTLLKMNLLRRYFGSIHVRRELRNVPPAYVLECRNQS